MNRHAFALALIAAWLTPAAHAAPLVDGVAVQPLVHVQPGTTVQLMGRLQNPTSNVVYVGGLGWAAPGTFRGSLDGLDFAHAAPESLGPGATWEGPLVRVDVATGGTGSPLHRLDVFVHGGLNRYEDELIAHVVFVLDDSTAAVGAPAHEDTRVLALSAGPNPTRGATRVAFTLPAAGVVDLRVLDVSGRTRRLLGAGRFDAGDHALVWDGQDGAGLTLPPGVYYVRLATSHGVRKVPIARVR